MRLRILVSLSTLFLALPIAGAQPADEFFHGGAQLYLSNNIPAALETVTNGLQHFPEDPKLKKLYELLSQQQQNQKDQKDQPEQKGDQKQDQPKPDEPKPQPEKKDQSKPDNQQKQKEAPDKSSQKKPDQKPEPAGANSKAKPDEKKDAGEPQAIAAHAMTPQEAQQLLDAQKGDEQILQFAPPSERQKQTKPLKDW